MRLSIVLVSDFEPTGTKTWKDETELIDALAAQDIVEPFEVLLIESAQLRDVPVPEHFYDAFSDLKVCYHDSIKSASLKDYGVGLSSGEYIAVLESDCLPSRNWLRLLLDAVDNSEFVIASGRTSYGEETSFRRIMNLLHRSWYDHGESGETSYVSNNGAVYRRDILEQFPYPEAVTPFQSAQLRNRQIRNAGHRLYFERTATMKHAIGGWSFVWDLQRNKGHQLMSLHHTRGWRAMPSLLVSKLTQNAGSCRRLGAEYLRPYDWLLLPFIALAELIPFSVGMADAIRQVEGIPGSAYR